MKGDFSCMGTQDTLNAIIENVGRLHFNFDAFKEQTIDEEVIDHYRERFLLFVDDDCPAAITAYMQKVQNDTSINELTKSHILLKATKALNGEEF